jgi:hypothetical protein
MADVAVLSSQQWQLFFSSMADMPFARQESSIMAVVAALSSQQWQLFFNSMVDKLPARQNAGVHHGSSGCSHLAALAAVLQQHGRYACYSSECRRVHHGSCGCSLLTAMTAVLQQ